MPRRIVDILVHPFMGAAGNVAVAALLVVPIVVAAGLLTDRPRSPQATALPANGGVVAPAQNANPRRHD